MMSTKKITQLPATSSVSGSDQLPIVQGGVTKRVTVATLAVAGPTGPAGATGATGVAETYQTGTQPAEANDGATWLDITNNKYYVRYDGQWIQVGGPED